MKPAKPTKKRGPRTCCVCGAQCGADGPWPLGWDSVLMGDAKGEPFMAFTCSPECRQKRGLPERQMGLFRRGES